MLKIYNIALNDSNKTIQDQVGLRAEKHLLMTYSLLTFLKYGMSLIELTMLSKLPNILLNPSVTNIIKKTMEKKVDPGSWLITSVIVMNAKPVPPLPCDINRISFSLNPILSNRKSAKRDLKRI